MQATSVHCSNDCCTDHITTDTAAANSITTDTSHSVTAATADSNAASDSDIADAAADTTDTGSAHLGPDINANGGTYVVPHTGTDAAAS
jgi:hypothetical protein